MYLRSTAWHLPCFFKGSSRMPPEWEIEGEIDPEVRRRRHPAEYLIVEKGLASQEFSGYSRRRVQISSSVCIPKR